VRVLPRTERQVLLEEGAIHLRPWIEPSSPRDPGIARIL
jgi:hypothetical protein